MKHFILMTVTFFMASLNVGAVEDTTYTVGDSAQVQVIDSVETNPGLMVDSTFRTLDPLYLSTNLLADKSLGFIDYSSYHGHLADSNRMDYSKLLRLNGAMLMAIHDTGYQVQHPDTLKHWMGHYDSLGYRPFALLNFQYNTFKDSVLANNLIQKNGIQLEDVPGRSENPYLTKRLFAGAFRTQQFQGPEYDFIIPSELFMSNTGETLDSLLVDFDDGNGFQEIALDSAYTVYNV